MGIVPAGYSYPKEDRAVRDFLRTRSQLVRHRTRTRVSLQTLLTRHTGSSLRGNRLTRRTREEVKQLLPQAELAVAGKSNRAGLHCLTEPSESREEVVCAQLNLREGVAPLLTVRGSGQSLGMTIRWETGELGRFATVGDVASYGRWVGSQNVSNGNRKGQGKTKNGNKSLAWAVVEAAHVALRSTAQSNRFYPRKQAKPNGVVAIKAGAHTLARAGYSMLRDQVPVAVTTAVA